MRLSVLKSNLPILAGRQMIQPGKRNDYGRKQNFQKLYNYQWTKTRARFLKERPLCVSCKAEGKICAATEVDHIIPHKGNEKLFWDADNWQPLCISCHSKKTMQEGGFGSNRNGSESDQDGEQNAPLGGTQK